jgi:hypothetical protein
MAADGWTWVLAMYREDGTAIGQYAIDADLEPAHEWAQHEARRAGHTGDGWRDRSRIVPLWHRSGQPVLRGFRVVLSPAGQPAVSCDFPMTYFGADARALSASLVAAGALSDGEVFKYLVMALPSAEERAPKSRLSLVVRDVTSQIHLRLASLADATRGASVRGEPLTGEMPVVTAGAVLDEISALTHAAGDLETGGVLIGHLLRDPDAREVFVRVTGQIPARLAEASEVRLAFSGDTWQDIQRQLDARRGDERIVGWWHSHPVAGWNSAEDAGEGPEPGVFDDCFSEHDLALHRAVFPGAHCVALVANRMSSSLVKFSVFGWHRAAIVRRGLHVGSGRG